MIRALLFDMDGVLIDNEPLWNTFKEDLFFSLVGKREEGLGKQFVGLSIRALYDYLVSHGATLTLEEFNEIFFQEAKRIYREAPLSAHLDDVGEYARMQGLRVAVVSASPLPWIQTVLGRTPFGSVVECVIALNEHPALRGKPAPDGYQEAMKQLKVEPYESLVIEDSNKGIQAGKASGAFTIGFRANLIPGYVQEGADTYIDDVREVISIVQEKNTL